MNGIGGTSRRFWAVRCAVVLAVGLLLWRLGPFGTFDELGPVERLAYWVCLTFLMWLQSVAALAIIGSSPRKSVPADLPRLVGAALIGAVPTAFQVAWAEMFLRVQRDLTPLDLLGIYGDVVLLAVPLLISTHLLIGRLHDDSAETGAARSDIQLRLPPAKRGRLLAIASEDHYIRIYTDRGDHLLHMRFGEALSQMPPGIGEQVHRGWWVARDAVATTRRDGDRTVVVLSNGTSVPVSRTYARGARDAGLLP